MQPFCMGPSPDPEWPCALVSDSSAVKAPGITELPTPRARSRLSAHRRQTAGGNCFEEHKNHIRKALGLDIVHWEREEDAWKGIELQRKIPSRM